MHATLLALQTLTDATLHHAFPACVRWRNIVYVAYRQAATHAIVPPGRVLIRRLSPPEEAPPVALTHPLGDVRDPRFLATPTALYCFCGVYLPAPGRQDLSADSADNLIQTHLTHTTDGLHWAPLRPILRPQYWGWSAVAVPEGFLMAAYHTGQHGDAASLVLCSGASLYRLMPYLTIYEGGGLQHEGIAHVGQVAERSLRYRHTSPCEPVLWHPDARTLACALRTESSMEVGVSRAPLYDDWRWWNTEQPLHPSAVLSTPAGTLLLARHVTTAARGTTVQWRQGVFALDAQHPRQLLTLPSAGDCAYGGLCAGDREGEVLVSYYSQLDDGQTPYGAWLPGAEIRLATLAITGTATGAASGLPAPAPRREGLTAASGI